MIVSRYNKHTGKYYHYDLDDYDYFTPMFDNELHDDSFDMEAMLHADIIGSSKTCLYCNTEFSSRNKLFKHLGYQGIDIRREQVEWEYDNMKRKRENEITRMLKRIQL
jgi:hypothetical protein